MSSLDAADDEDALLQLSSDWEDLRQRISEADLDDRSLWSEPINGDPLAAFTRALNDQEEVWRRTRKAFSG
jgi:hypothetical protein